jgi:hypothetical protein
MGNPQAIREHMNIETVVGLYLGEGHFSISKFQRKNSKWQFGVEVGFSNSDPSLIDYVCQWQESLGIHHYIRQNSQGCYQIVVQHHEDVLHIIDVLSPYMFGNKKAEAALVKRFVLGRIARSKGNNKERGYTQEDHDLVEEARLCKSSTTKSIPVCTAIHGYTGTEYKPYRNVVFNNDDSKWHAVQ